MPAPTPPKPFDTLAWIRAVRDEISEKIAGMTVEEENRWLRATEFKDPTLRRLMELAAERRRAAGETG